MGLLDGIINEDDLLNKLVRPALQEIQDQTIPAVRYALAVEIDRFVDEIGKVIGGLPTAIQNVGTKILSDANLTLLQQDGWTLEVHWPQDPIRIRLTKPKENA